jgi:hypothetical protein
LTSLFANGLSGTPSVDKEHAYLIWVSDWSIEAGFTAGGLSLAVLPAGQATVYYSSNPTSRIWTDLSNRSTWGVPVATFVRGGGLFQSPDNWASDKFFFSAQLTSSKSFAINKGGQFNFRELVPQGVTCYEFGLAESTAEAGACVAFGGVLSVM